VAVAGRAIALVAFAVLTGARSAEKIRPYNIASGIGGVVTYAYGVYDGVQGYRQLARAGDPTVRCHLLRDRSIFGIAGSF
jgi:hypothetical protein